jgi:hypothetical protein
LDGGELGGAGELDGGDLGSGLDSDDLGSGWPTLQTHGWSGSSQPGLGLVSLDLAATDSSEFLFFFIFSDGFCSGGFDFLIFFFLMDLALDIVFWFFFFGFSYGSGDF